MVHVMLVLLVAAQAVRFSRRGAPMVEMAHADVGYCPAAPKFVPVIVSAPPVVAKEPPAGEAIAVRMGTACTMACTAIVIGATPKLVGPAKSVSLTLTQAL